MSKKKRINIHYPAEFTQEIDNINRLLKYSQPEHKRFFLNLIPYPFSAGNEIAYRYFEFMNLNSLCKELIKEFVPSTLQDYYFNKLPQTPLQKVLKNIQLSSEIKKEQQAEAVNVSKS